MAGYLPIGGNGGGTGINLPDDHIFATAEERDAAIPSPKQGEQCAVQAGEPEYHLLQEYRGDEWVDITYVIRGPKGDPANPSDLIDDSEPSENKTYSSNKIEARIEADGFPNDGYIILNESYKTLKKGATYIYGRDDDLSELPDLNSRQINIVNFGDIYDENQNLFLLASPDDDDGIWCWTRVAGGTGGHWFKIGSYNDMLKLDAITNTGSGKIITAEERVKINKIPDPIIGKFLGGIDNQGNANYINLPIVSQLNSENITAENIPSPSNAINLTPSNYTSVVDNNGYLILKLDTHEIESDIEELNSKTIGLIYKSFSEFNNTLSDPITLYELGFESKTDDEIRSLNLKLITNEMPDNSTLYNVDGANANVCADSYSICVINRFSATRCYAVSYPKQGGGLSTWSSATDANSEWNLVITDSNIDQRIGHVMSTDAGEWNAESKTIKNLDKIKTTSNLIDLSFSRITNIQDPVGGSDAVSLQRLNQDFDSLSNPVVLSEVYKFSDDNRNDGYGKNKTTITYSAPNESENWKILDISQTGHPFMFVHRSVDTTRGFLFIHKSVINQYVGEEYSRGEIGIVINSNQKGNLGKSNQVIEEGSIWNLQGFSIDENDNANNYGDDVSYTGNDATYSAGVLKNDGSSLAILSEYRIVNGKTEIRYNSQSEYYALAVNSGGGTFGVFKEFMHFQNSFSETFTLQLFDSVADIAGSNILALANSIDDQSEMISSLDVRVSDLEGDSKIEDLTSISQQADENGVIESIIMPSKITTQFILNAGSTVTKKLGYNQALTNLINFMVTVASVVDSTLYHKFNGHIYNGVFSVDDEEYTNDFDITITKSVEFEQIKFEIGGSSENVNISVIAEVLS